MPKRLVMFCDGTWNTPDQATDGRPCPTNVTKLALAVPAQGPDGVPQRVFYHPGVGTRRWERLRGGAFGFGLSRNVRETYRFLIDSYEPGDEIFFFGFSRGAFTARSTAGLVRSCGVLRPESAHRVREAYALYRSRTAHPREVEATLFRRSHSYEPRIRFIGVWDTVGSLGIPLNGLRWVNALNRRWQFHDTDLSTRVDAAFQALAVDEQRRPFRPAVWRQQPGAGDQRLEQVWFSGVHCDVGGGYVDPALADIALRWMADRARSCGLAVSDDLAAAPPSGQPGPPGRLHDSRTGFYRLLSPLHRTVGDADPDHEYAASTAARRRDEDPTYRPPGLVAFLDGGGRVMPV